MLPRIVVSALLIARQPVVALRAPSVKARRVKEADAIRKIS